MYKTTLSFHLGNTFCFEHNQRTMKSSPNINPDKSYKNVYYDPYNSELKEFFDKHFEKSFKEYQNTLRPSKRKYNSYFDKISAAETKGIENEAKTIGHSYKKKRKNYKKSLKELIVQLGNYDNAIPPEFQKEILLKYANEFEKRNPNFVVFQFAIHGDEQSDNYHLHLDFCSIAEDKNQGTIISQTKALHEMGFDTDANTRTYAITKWQNRERDYIKSLCKEYDVEIISGNSKEKHLNINEYRNRKQALQIKKEYKRLIELQKSMNNNQDIIALQSKIKELEKTYKEILENEKNRYINYMSYNISDISYAILNMTERKSNDVLEELAEETSKFFSLINAFASATLIVIDIAELLNDYNALFELNDNKLLESRINNYLETIKNIDRNKNIIEKEREEYVR